MASHSHNYWGNPPAPEVLFFQKDDVELETFPVDEGMYAGCNAIGYYYFDSEDDGNDDEASGKTDVVYPGTAKIRVQISWGAGSVGEQQHIDGLVFSYKPANQRGFVYDTVEGLPSRECGVVLNDYNGKDFHIPVGELQFDPAHQRRLSRWRFQLFAYAPPMENPSVSYPGMAVGRVSISMYLVYGGDVPLDPPHPNRWNGASLLPLGNPVERETNVTIIADPNKPVPAPEVVSSPFGYRQTAARHIDAIRFDRGHVVPLKASRIEVEACINPGKVPNPGDLVSYRLAFHDANFEAFTLLDAPTTQGTNWGCPLYVIAEDHPFYVENDLPFGVDSPYEIESQWEFRIVPITAGQAYVGHVVVKYSLAFTAHCTEPIEDCIA